MAEEYQRAIESAFARIGTGPNRPSDRNAMVSELCDAGLPFAAIAVVPCWDDINTSTDGILSALAASPNVSAMTEAEIAAVGTALTFWVSPRVVCAAVPAGSPLRAALAYEDDLGPDGSDPRFVDHVRAGADPRLLAEVDAARRAERCRWLRAGVSQWSADVAGQLTCFYPATDSAVGWVVHIASRLEFLSRRDVEPAIVGHALRGDIDPEFALGVCLHLRIKERITGAQPADPMSEIAAILAEAIERRRRPALVLPTVII